MAGNYEIKKVYTSDDFAMLRVPVIQIENSSIDMLIRSVSKKEMYSMIDKLYMIDISKSFYEVFMRLDLKRLRNISNNLDKKEQFINSRLPESIASKSSTGQLLPVIILVIDIKAGDKITDTDIDYINDMLTPIYNKIFVTPLLYFDDTINNEVRIKFYEDFVKRLLENKKSISRNFRVAASIPSFYPRIKIENVLSLYDSENKSPAFTFIDFERHRITTPKIIGIVNSIKRFFINEEGDDPKYAIYGFNVNPHKMGELSPMAEDMGCYLSGISAIGDAYRLNWNKIFTPPSQRPPIFPRLFCYNQYRYVSINCSPLNQEFDEWFLEYGSPLFHSSFNRMYSTHIYRFNVDKIIRETLTISNMIKKGELPELRKKLENKDITKAVMGKIQ